MKTYILILFISFFGFFSAYSQAERSSLVKGNKLYEKERYAEAETEYREALEKNMRSLAAVFNLGDALYKQGKYDKAREQFELATVVSTNEKVIYAAFHNIGNTYMQEANYSQSIEYYKSALKINPKDDETRYNLALANVLLKKQLSQQQNQQNNNDGGGDNNQEQQNQDELPQQNEENSMSKENAQQILDAFAEEEKDLQQRMNESRMSQDNESAEKDW